MPGLLGRGLEIGDQIGAIDRIGDARKGHARTGNDAARLCHESIQRFGIPADFCFLHGGREGEIGHRTGCAAEDAIERRTHFLHAGLHIMTQGATGEHGLALYRITRLSERGRYGNRQ